MNRWIVQDLPLMIWVVTQRRNGNKEAINFETRVNADQPTPSSNEHYDDQELNMPAQAQSMEEKKKEEDWPDWVAGFEIPGSDEELERHERINRDVTLIPDGWDLQWSQHPSRYDPYLDKHNPVDRQRQSNFKRRRQGQSRAIKSYQEYDVDFYILVDNDHTPIPLEDYFDQLMGFREGNEVATRRRSRKNQNPGSTDRYWEYNW